MNKNEQSQLCMLLAKMRYDIMEMLQDTSNSDFIKECDEVISAINRILSYSYINGNNKQVINNERI
mgnify:CR=1 FL=1